MISKILSVDDPNEKGRNDPVRLFAERVTVAGLEESYQCRDKHDRITFRISLILASAAIIYCSYQVIKMYSNRGPVYNYLDVIGVQAPFPTVIVCGPDAIKRSYVRQLTSVDPYKQQVNELMRRFNVSYETVIERFANLVSFSTQGKPPLTPFYRAALKLINTFQLFSTGDISQLTSASPGCADMLSACSFEMQSFNCCRAAQQMPFDGSICYELDLSRIEELSNSSSVSGGPKDDPSRLRNSGLSVIVNIDWPDVVFFDGVASDGFIVFVDPVATPWSNPITLSSGMDAIIVLSSPRKVYLKSKCRPGTGLDKADAHGDVCVAKEMANSISRSFGCTLPTSLSDLSSNTSNQLCTGAQLLQFLRVLDGTAMDAIESADAGGMKYFFSGYKEKETTVRSAGKHAFQHCLPFCTSFVYSILSASYGSFHKQDQVDWDRARENNSWSRIRIFFPSSTYKLHVEEYTGIGYMAMCEVGGVIGVYLGLSMITVMQIMAYGFLICFNRKNACQRRTLEVSSEEPRKE